MTLPAFPDVEVALCNLLGDLASTGTVTPADLQAHLPFIRARRFGGSDDVLTDTARVTVDVFAGTRAAAYLLGETVRQRLISTPSRIGTLVLDRVTTTTAPSEVPWDDPNVRRVTATYTVSARR